jgi:DNA-binding transcriptional ArsR family regulator
MQETRAKILEILYNQAKENPYSFIDASELAEKLNLTLDQIELELDYLDEKGFIRYDRVLGGGGFVRIAAYGIDAVESPEMFINEAPFLQQIIIYGNVIDSAILQAESIRIRDSLNKIYNAVEDEELKELISQLIHESEKDKPDGNKIKEIIQQIKEKAPELATRLIPYAMEILKKWLSE